jgi:predicted nucleic acid-binding Zn ribbon protein
VTDCELYGHPNVTGTGCPCGLLVSSLPPPAPWPREPEPLVMTMHLASKRRRPSRHVASFRPRRFEPKPPPRVQQVVYP